MKSTTWRLASQRDTAITGALAAMRNPSIRAGRRRSGATGRPSATTSGMSDLAFQRCIDPSCRATVDLADTAFRCPKCGGLLDVAYDWDRLPVPQSLAHFEAKWLNRSHPLDFSGV